MVASNNPGKLAELRRLLRDVAVTLVGLRDAGYEGDPPEPHTTYEDNARAKAEAVSAVTGLPALADDSGIEVPGLGGSPGPRSARWMGEKGKAGDRERLRALLDRIARESPGDRRARYVAAVALAVPGRETVIAHGSCEGVLVDPPRGERGFGYDPAFLSDDLGITFGEADDAAKDGVSHRARAVRLMLRNGALDAISDH